MFSNLTYDFKDKNGSVKLYKQGEIVVVVLSGACGTRVIDFYAKKLQELAHSFNSQPWAYLCNGKEFEATTPEAQQTIVSVYDYCLKSGCRFEAYCFDSLVGKVQTQQIMKDCGNPTDIESVLFENKQLAEDFLINKLAKLNGKRSQTAKIFSEN
jgi:hypothetical protein